MQKINIYVSNNIINTEGQKHMWKKRKELVSCEETLEIDSVEFDGVELSNFEQI